MESTYVFDVNETLLDTSVLDEHFEAGFGAARVRQEWFAELLQRALVCNALGEYRPFPELGAAALDAIAHRYGKRDLPRRDAILRKFASMPAHADVPAALAHLQSAGARLFALTNSPLEGAERALEQAGIRDRFAQVLSVETIRCFKPDRRVYEMAAAAASEEHSRLVLISAHWWDCAGAARMGWKTAMVVRSGSYNDGTMVRPKREAGDLLSLAHQLAPVTESPAP